MLKRLLTLILATGFVQMIFTACCNETMTYYSRLLSVGITHATFLNELSDSAVVPAGDYRIMLDMTTELYVEASPILAFSNSAYAFTPCPDSYVGLEPDLNEFILTCSEDLLETPAGTPLDLQKLSFYSLGYQEDTSNVRINYDDWLKEINNNSNVDHTWYIEFNDTISSNDYLMFTLQMTTADEQSYSAETGYVKIE